MQAHPDARPYKNKAVPNFNDLCLIYGYTTADGRYSRSSHDVDIEDDSQGGNLGALSCLLFVLWPDYKFFNISLLHELQQVLDRNAVQTECTLLANSVSRLFPVVSHSC